MRLSVVLVLAALGAGAVVAHRSAGACGMLLDPPKERPEAIARMADELLQAGKESSAANEIWRHEELAPFQGTLLRTLADAEVRRDDPQRAEELRWAVSSLEEIAKSEKETRGGAHPRTLTALALGLSRIDERRAAGHELLAKLARDDLLTSPHAYAALARLRDEAGNRHGAAEARERCRLMLENPDDVCGRSEARNAS